MDKEMLAKILASLDLEALEARLDAVVALGKDMLSEDEDVSLNKAMLRLLESGVLQRFIARKGGTEREVFGLLSGFLVGLVTPVEGGQG